MTENIANLTLARFCSVCEDNRGWKTNHEVRQCRPMVHEDHLIARLQSYMLKLEAILNIYRTDYHKGCYNVLMYRLAGYLSALFLIKY